MITLGKLLTHYRGKAGISPSEADFALQLNPGTTSDVEKDAPKKITGKLLLQYAVLYKIGPEKYLELVDLLKED